MKTILCFGDSNTWGWNPIAGQRYGRDQRWPGVMRNGLDEEYLVVEEGLNGRTTVWDDPVEGDKNGSAHLPMLLDTHRPLDLVIIMLGTNDLKARFCVPACDIAAGAASLVDIVLGSVAGPAGTAPKVLLCAPPPLGKLTNFAEMLAGGKQKSQRFGAAYKAVADVKGVSFLDTARHIRSSDIDGVHWEAETHGKLGKMMAETVRGMLE
jgi:lysophospholipase L1-like esterase